jgi:hypothetical protein
LGGKNGVSSFQSQYVFESVIPFTQKDPIFRIVHKG